MKKPDVKDLLSDDEVFNEDEEEYAPEPEIIEDDEDDKKKKKKKKSKELKETEEIEEDNQSNAITEEQFREEKDKLLDELYALDYEDMIGDMPTRFKYHKVKKLDPKISTEEILLATDKELKQYLSMKKLAPYREKNPKIEKKKKKQFEEQLKERLKEEGFVLDDEGHVIEAPVIEKPNKRKYNDKDKKSNKKHKKNKKNKSKNDNNSIKKGRLATYDM